MGRIKSAWEIALERTEAIKVDVEKIKRNAEIDKIRRAAGSFLIADNEETGKLQEDLAGCRPEAIREALSQTVLNSLVLPQDENSFVEERLRRTSILLAVALPGNQEAYGLFSQLCQHMQQYPQHKKQLTEQLKVQYEPMLRQKEEQMKAQYGEGLKLTFEQDKECMQILRQYLDRLTDQYEGVLADGKEKLKALFD